jgi:hypothetical protein
MVARPAAMKTTLRVMKYFALPRKSTFGFLRNSISGP